jgi:hypothetical protein
MTVPLLASFSVVALAATVGVVSLPVVPLAFVVVVVVLPTFVVIP